MTQIDQLFHYLDDNLALAVAVIGTAAIAIALAALAVALLALLAALGAAHRQRRHDVRSAAPLPAVTVTDLEDCLKVEIENNGVGPLIVKSVRARKGKETRPSIHAWMPELPGHIAWTQFASAVESRAVAPGERLTLIELAWDEDEIGFADFTIVRNTCRAILGALTLSVSHTDIYGTRMDPFERTFGTP